MKTFRWFVASGLGLFLLTVGAPAWGQADADVGVKALPAPAATIDLLPAPTVGRLDRVTVELEVGGHLLRPQDPADRTSSTTKAAMSVNGELEYDERRLTEARSARHYRRAKAKLTTGGRTKSPQLPADRRLIVADDRGRAVQLFAPAGPLTRDQLDLVDVIGVTLGVDALLPTAEVEVEGGEWKIDGPAMGRLLGLAEVDVCDITAVLDKVNDRHARFQLAGVVHGTVDGAKTEVELRGVGLFSRQEKRLTQLNLAVREDRKVGPATPGFLGVAKARIKIKPLGPNADTAPALAASRAARLAKLRPGASASLAAAAVRQGFTLRHDRRWFAAEEDRRSLVLRRVDGADLAAQATFSVSESSSDPSLRAFESRVRASIAGAKGGEVVSSEQWTNPAGCRCVGVVARGSADGVPVEWRYYRAAGVEGTPTAGRRVTLAATIEPTADQQAGAAARGLIDSLEITPRKPIATAKRRARRKRK